MMADDRLSCARCGEALGDGDELPVAVWLELDARTGGFSGCVALPYGQGRAAFSAGCARVALKENYHFPLRVSAREFAFVELRNALDRFGCGAASESIADRLVARYEQPHRVYHSAQHLAEAIRALHYIFSDTAIDEQDQLRAMIALGYHDAIHAAGDSDNEERSAALLADEIGRSCPDNARVWIEGMRDAILKTRTHTVGGAAATWKCAVIDADLAVLGSGAVRYREYTEQVRAEYSSVSNADWCEGRGAFLEGLLKRPHLYCTATARHMWGGAARANLTGELASLRRGAASA